MHLSYPTTLFLGLISCLLIISETAHSQIVSHRISTSQTGTAANKASTGIPTLTLPAVDPTPLLAEDQRDAALGRPFRFGMKQLTDVTLPRDGGRHTHAGWTTNRYRIQATGAFSVNLLFDQFRLVAGAEFRIYNTDSTFVIGPITSAQNPQNGQFWSDLLPGSGVIVELREPATAPASSTIHLCGAVHGYKNTFPGTDKVFSGAGSCQKNVICYPTYQTEADGVAMILLADGTRWCTGTLMNASSQQFRSFFLTAFHCLDANANGQLETAERADAQNWLFRFGYQSPGCSPSAEDPDFVTINGADLRASRYESDFLLLELRQQVTPAVNPTYLGWDRSNALPSSMVGIHHPNGDVKKISFASGTATLTDYINPTGTTHLQVQWGEFGVTEPGSSGSPILNANRRVVGQLHGGPSECGGALVNRYDLYGRLATSWNSGNSYDTRLRDWLDPSNLLTTLGSTKAVISGPASVSTTGVFQLNSNSSSGINWTVTAPAGVVVSRVVSPTAGTGASATFMVLSGASNLSVTFGVSAGQPYPIRFTRAFSTQLPSQTATANSTSVSVATTPLTTSTPTYDCLTRILTLRATGGSPLPLEFMVVGVRRWETDPVVELPEALVGDRLTNSVTIYTRQFNGVDPPKLSSRMFNFRAACPNNP